MTDKRHLNVAIIGLGYRSTLAKHLLNFGSKIIAVADTSAEALDSFMAEHKIPDCKSFTSAEEMLKANLGIDVVFILSPDYLHVDHALLSFQAGCDVFLEKPLAIDPEGCETILAAAHEHQRKLYVGHNMRHMKFVKKMKELIESDIIGEVKTAWCRHFIGFGGETYFNNWYSDKSKSHSLLVQKACHDLDILMWLCAGRPHKVSAMGKLTFYDQENDQQEQVIDVEDLSMLMTELDNGVLISYQQCHFSPDHWRNFTIIGTKGRIENFGDGYTEDTSIKLWNKKAYYGEADQTFEIEAENREFDLYMIKECLDYFLHDKPCSISPQEAKDSALLTILATDSLRTGSTVKTLK